MGCRMLSERSTHCGEAWGGVFDVVALGQNTLIVDAGLVEKFEHGLVRRLEPMTRVNEEVNPREIRATFEEGVDQRGPCLDLGLGRRGVTIARHVHHGEMRGPGK